VVERIRPGTPAPDAEVDEVVRLLQGLHVVPPAEVPSLEAVVGERLAAAANVTAQRLGWAAVALERLAAEAPSPVLLHGSLGPGAVLRCARRGLCAVAPTPCAGDAAYDAAWWIHADGKAGRRARFEALAAALSVTTGCDRTRLRDWCGVVAIHGTSPSVPR
jgi:streptomycin 6-kinase